MSDLQYNPALPRGTIFRAIDAEYDGDRYFNDIKQMDTALLTRVSYYLIVGNLSSMLRDRDQCRKVKQKDSFENR